MQRRGWPDARYVNTGHRAHTATRRNLLGAAVCAALLALCVCCAAIASTAPAAPLGRSASSKAVKHIGKRHARCAKPASFHSSNGATGESHRSKRHVICRKRHASTHRKRAVKHAASPVGGACTGAALRPSATNLESVSAATLCLVNVERTSRGERALRPDSELQRAAQSHSASMAANDYFEHDGRNGDTPLSRLRATGYIFSSHIGYAIGENIGWGTLWLASPKAIVASWMASPGHRANILDATFRDSGIGVSPHPIASLARGQAGAVYTQDFGRIIKP
jgi:uncharacterized protein YkwD